MNQYIFVLSQTIITLAYIGVFGWVDRSLGASFPFFSLGKLGASYIGVVYQYVPRPI
jgi:hypothetical protein